MYTWRRKSQQPMGRSREYKPFWREFHSLAWNEWTQIKQHWQSSKSLLRKNPISWRHCRKPEWWSGLVIERIQMWGNVSSDTFQVRKIVSLKRSARKQSHTYRIIYGMAHRWWVFQFSFAVCGFVLPYFIFFVAWNLSDFLALCQVLLQMILLLSSFPQIYQRLNKLPKD